MNAPRFLHDPKVTYRALKALVAVCAAQLAALVLLGPIIAPVLGQHDADAVTHFATKAAAVCSLLVAALGWITATGRSIVTAVDDPPPEPPAAVEIPRAA